MTKHVPFFHRKKHRKICVEGSLLKAGLIGFGNKASSLLSQFAEFSAATDRIGNQY